MKSRIFVDSFSGALADLPKGQRTTLDALRTLVEHPQVSTFDRSYLPWVDRLVRDLLAQGLIVEERVQYPWHRFALTDAGRAALGVLRFQTSKPPLTTPRTAYTSGMDDLIERLARDAGLPQTAHYPGMPPRPGVSALWGTELRRFAALVAEECAKECDEQMNGVDQPSDCATAIRARFGCSPA